jgi:L-rhamnose mutarotase
MIYVMHIREIIPEKMNEYNEFQVKEYQPFLQKTGRKVVAYWTTTIGNAAESIAVFAFNDMADFQKSMADMQKQPEYPKLNAKLMSMTARSNSRLLSPCSWSPMK